MTIVIERGIPVPTPLIKYPFRGMEVGDSFVIKEDDEVKRASDAAASYKRNHEGWSYAARKLYAGGCRIWRTK